MSELYYENLARGGGRRARKGDNYSYARAQPWRGARPGKGQRRGGQSQCTRSKRTGRRSCTSRRAERCRRGAHTERERRHRPRSDRRNRPHTKRQRRRHWCTTGRRREEGNAGCSSQQAAIRHTGIYNRARRAGGPSGGAGEPGPTGQEGGRERSYGQKEAEGGGGGGRGEAVSRGDSTHAEQEPAEDSRFLCAAPGLVQAWCGYAPRAGRRRQDMALYA
jgi:hypothetical protein